MSLIRESCLWRNDKLFLKKKLRREVRHVDVGCGFGGLTVALAALFPDKLVLGLEIRAKVFLSDNLPLSTGLIFFVFVQVCEYVRLRINALRTEFHGQYQNAACLRFST